MEEKGTGCPVMLCVGMVQSCAREGLTLGNIALPKGWADTGTDFLESGLMPQAFVSKALGQCL